MLKSIYDFQSFDDFRNALAALILEGKIYGISSEELYTALDVWIDLEIADKMDGEFTPATESPTV